MIDSHIIIPRSGKSIDLENATTGVKWRVINDAAIIYGTSIPFASITKVRTDVCHGQEFHNNWSFEEHPI